MGSDKKSILIPFFAFPRRQSAPAVNSDRKNSLTRFLSRRMKFDYSERQKRKLAHPLNGKGGDGL